MGGFARSLIPKLQAVSRSRAGTFVWDSPLLMFHAAVLLLHPSAINGLLLVASTATYVAIDMLAIARVGGLHLRHLRGFLSDGAQLTTGPIAPGTFVTDGWIKELCILRRRWSPLLSRDYRLHAFIMKERTGSEIPAKPLAIESGTHIFAFTAIEPTQLDAWEHYRLLRSIVRAVARSQWSIFSRTQQLRWCVFASWTGLVLGRLDAMTIALLALAALLQLIVLLDWELVPGARLCEAVSDVFRADFFLLTRFPRSTLTAIADRLRSGEDDSADLLTDSWIRVLRDRVVQDLLERGTARVPTAALRTTLRVEMLNLVTAGVLVVAATPIAGWRSITAVWVAVALFAFSAFASLSVRVTATFFASEMEASVEGNRLGPVSHG